jgi:hypothetical protein
MTRLKFDDLPGIILVMLVICFPFQYHLLEAHTHIIRYLFAPIDLYLAKTAGLNPEIRDLSSDSTGLYVHVVFITVLSLLIFLFIRKFMMVRSVLIWRNSHRILLSYFMALILFKYGFDKLFLLQFPAPEPNLLYTPLGKMDRDILFWTSMGSSPLFNRFTGGAEIFLGLLLLYRKTRSVGAILSVGTFLFILIINLSFDISVKLFSTLLLLISLYVAWPDLKRIWHLLVLKSIAESEKEKSYSPKSRLLKMLVLILMTAEVTIPYFSLDKRSFPLHGAYENRDKNGVIQKLFIHHDGYLIFQDRKEDMTDLKLTFHPTLNIMQLTDYEGKHHKVPFETNNKGKTLNLVLNGEYHTFEALKWKELPLRQELFHWTVD